MALSLAFSTNIVYANTIKVDKGIPQSMENRSPYIPYCSSWTERKIYSLNSSTKRYVYVGTEERNASFSYIQGYNIRFEIKNIRYKFTYDGNYMYIDDYYTRTPIY